MSERGNYYLLLDLDPSVEDEAAIEKAITESKRKWSAAGQASIAVRRKAEAALKQLDDIRRVMMDPVARKDEAKEAKRLKLQERQERFARLDQAITMVRVSGTCTKGQIAEIVKSLGGTFTEAEVLDRLRAAGLSVDAEGKKTTGSAMQRPRLDSTKLKMLDDGLAFVGAKTLYELLKMSSRSSAKSLRDTADERNRELKRIGRTDPESTARSQLYGSCMDVFSSEQEREKYDNSLAFIVMNELRPLLNIAGMDGFLTIDEQDHIVKEARERGVESEDARAFIHEVAQLRKWGVQATQRLPSEELPQCGFCGALAKSPSAKHCECGESLVLKCPRCDTDMPTSIKACGHCGGRLDDAAIVKSLLHEGRKRAADGDFVGALASVDRALSYWIGWEPAKTIRREIVAKRDDHELAILGVETLVAARKFFEARATLEQLRRSFGTKGTEELASRITAAIVRAEKFANEGQTFRTQGRDDEAIASYEQAIELCVDLAAARSALAAVPPPAPEALTVTSFAAGYRLAWKARTRNNSRSRFIVVRKTGGRPQHHADGTIVGEVSDPQCDDLTVQEGVPCYYAIFAARGDVVSRESAYAGPLLLARDVRDAHALAGDREVTLRWERPHGCVRIEVWRAMGDAPNCRGQGELLPAGGDGLQDGGRDNGKRYGYRIVTVYADPKRSGAELYSSGITLLATPALPPPPILDLSAVRSGPNIILTWTPSRLPLQIRKGTRLPDSRPGSLLPLTEVERFGALVDLRSTGTTEVRVDSQGQIVFTPLTVAGANVVVGRPVALTTIEDVTDLRAQTNGRDIVLTWRWPTGADEVVVAWRNDTHPTSPNEVNAAIARVTRAGYERNNGWELRAPKPERHFFTVFVKATSGDLYSGGARIVEAMGHGTTVSYRVGLKKSGLLGRTIQAVWIDLECGELGISLPTIVVMAKDGFPPLSPTDGALLVDAPSVKFIEGRARIELPTERARASTFVKLFFKDGRYAKEIRLLPGSNNELCLG